MILQAHTDIGRRDENQDTTFAEWTSDGRILLVAADGVGGYPGGGLASRLAAESVRMTMDRLRKDPPAGALRSAFEEAQRAVVAQQIYHHARMSSTLVAAVIVAGQVWVAHVGDSRAYLVVDGEARRLTMDHSFVEDRMRAGLLNEGDPEVDANRHIITRAIGFEGASQCDGAGPVSVEVGAAVLLSTDGLHDVLSDSEIASIVSGGGNHIAQELVGAALDAGGHDNIGVALHVLPPRGNGTA